MASNFSVYNRRKPLILQFLTEGVAKSPINAQSQTVANLPTFRDRAKHHEGVITHDAGNVLTLANT
jgi:hypothetical protein